MINFDSFSSIGLTISVIILIMLVFLAFMVVESRFTRKYRETFRTDARAIKFLETQYQEVQSRQQKIQNWDITLDTQSYEWIDWLHHYLDGDMQHGMFRARVEHGKFVFLCWPSKLNYPVPQSPSHFVPTLLTTIGILGTFLGVSIGLQGIDLQAANDFTSLQESITALIEGLRTAFYTSVVGMCTAIVSILWIIPRSAGTRQKSRDNLRNRLSAIAVLETPTHFLSRMSNEANQDASHDLKQAVHTLSTFQIPGAREIGLQVAESLQPSFNQISENLSTQRETIASQHIPTAMDIGEKIAEELQPAFHKILHELSAQREANAAKDIPTADAIGMQVAKALQPAFSKISDDLSTQREAIEADRQELLTHLISKLRTEIVEPVAQQLNASASMTREASEAVLELKNELGGISQSLASSVETIQRFQTKTLEELQQFASSLQQTLNDFQSETKGVLNQVATDVRSAVDQSIEGMKAQRTAFEESAERASQVMDTAWTNLHSTLSNIDEMLSNTHMTVQEELEKFREGYQGSLATFFDQQNDQLSGLLDQQRQGLTDIVEELRQVFQNDAQIMAKHIHDSMANVRDTAKAVGDLVNTLGLAEGHQMAQLKELAKEMGDEVQRIQTSHTDLIKQVEADYQNMSQQLQEALINGNEQLSKYLKEADEVYSRNLQNFDRDAAKVCQGLESTSGLFIGIAEHLVMAAEQLHQSQNGHR